MAQLHAKDGRLQCIEAEISADNGMMVLGLHAVHAQHAQLVVERGVLRNGHAAVAETSEVLARKERIATHVADGTRLTVAAVE